MSTQIGDAKRTLSTGDLVISVGEIFDRLQTKVDPNTLEQLLRDILAGRRSQVRPGELITAELINQILAELESLQVRVTKLEAGGGGTVSTEPTPVILDWQPHDGVQLRHRLDVTGQNFPAVPNEKSVDIAGTPVLFFLSASPTSLSFEIPPTVTPGTALMTIRNGTRSASVNINVVQEVVIPKGELFVNDVTPTLDKFEVGKTFIFVFELDSQTIPSEDYTFAVNFSDAVGSATVDDWKKNTQMLLATTGGAVSSSLKLGPQNKVRVNVSVKIPAGAVSINMALRVNSVNSPSDPLLNRSSRLIGIIVGSQQAPNDPRTTFSINKIGPAAPARVNKIDGVDGVEVLYGGSPLIPIKAMFTKSGNYEFSASIEEADTTVWVISSVTPAGFKSGDSGEQLINVNVNLKKATPDVSGQHSEKNVLIVTASRTDTDEKFTSFTRIPIQGFARSP